MSDNGAVSALPPLKDDQARASAPDGHVWLSASAGTGKTQVLTARVYRLLLRGVDPSAILCLTFTKAGAAEMAGRIGARLAAWVRLAEPQLVADLAALGEDATPELRARARTLFAKVLDAPGGGIRIQTIHGFCQSLLAAFPVEAGLAPGFRPIEAREEAVLAREALAELLVEADAQGRTRPVEAVGALSVRLGEGEAEKFLIACARAPKAMAALPSGYEGVAALVRRQLDLPPGDIEAAIVAACGDDAVDHEAIDLIGGMNAGWATKSGLSRASVVSTWLERSPVERAASLADLHLVWAKADGDLRSFKKGQAPQDEDYAATATALCDWSSALLSMRHRAGYADLLAAALDVGRDYAAAYAQAKRRLGAVDFDDLITATIDLLRQPGIGEWVRFKLDRDTSHILIDEAQDTNPEQWAIIGALADEYFAGQGAHGGEVRTLFTVGDFKQAIFGFQGTDPAFFAAAEDKFGRLARGAWDAESEARHLGDPTFAGAWNRLSLTQSFRSTRPVLEFVDATMAVLPEPGLGPVAILERHASEVPGPGTVTLWPLVVAGGSEEDEEGWIADSTRELAKRIARAIKGWIGTLMLESKGHVLEPQDVMILVKRRGDLASLIVARLYAEGVPVAGVDRLRLNAPLSVQDLLAAIRFVLQPEDDLSLASLLVSPLIGWTQEQLMAAAPRESGSLWRHLERIRGDDLGPLREMLDRADIATPYQFLEELLSGPLGGRRSLLRRLGQEARDPIEELLTAALQFETQGTPSLQRFLDWFDRGEVEIKRDPSAPLDAVRVMTAHGAKGLQAPLVILADAAVDPTKSPRNTLRWDIPELDAPLPIFRPRKEEAGPLGAIVETVATRELEEHWRLFYVAATRAEERLVIAGSLGPLAKGEPPPASWYAAAAQAMTDLGITAADDGTQSFTGTVAARPIKRREHAVASAAPFAPVPDWAHRAAPVEARPPRPLAPSSLGDDAVSDPPPTAVLRAAAERGRLIHALFERLPAIAPDQRAAAAERWLAGAGGVADVDLRAEITTTVLTILTRPEFAALFGPDALAEAPIAAVVGDGVVVSGTVDRLLVTEAGITVVDFKTVRSAPRGLDEVPAYHLRQMAAYVEALGAIFPGRPVTAALLYTATPVLFALPPALLAAHKPGFAGAQQS